MIVHQLINLYLLNYFWLGLKKMCYEKMKEIRIFKCKKRINKIRNSMNSGMYTNATKLSFESRLRVNSLVSSKSFIINQTILNRWCIKSKNWFPQYKNVNFIAVPSFTSAISNCYANKCLIFFCKIYVKLII